VKARIEPRFTAFSVDIWFYDHDPVEGNALVVYRPSGEGTMWDREIVPNGAEMPSPSLSIPNDALEAIVAAGADHLPPSSAQAEHLADVRAVRDRMLTIVERVASQQ
jgi:hypothetical protein